MQSIQILRSYRDQRRGVLQFEIPQVSPIQISIIVFIHTKQWLTGGLGICKAGLIEEDVEMGDCTDP